jgi:hypothetical protein
MELQELGRGSMDWIELAQDRESFRENVTVVMDLQIT